MSTQLPKFESMQTIGSSSFGVNVDGLGWKYINAGDYIWETVGYAYATRLRSTFENLLKATGPGSVANTVVTIDDSTGKLTITWGSGTHSIDFSSVAQSRIGAASSSYGIPAASWTGEYAVKGRWSPNVMPSGLSGSFAGVFARESDRRVAIARSGAVWARKSTTRRPTTFRFRGVTVAKVWTANESTVNESFETFLTDGLLARSGAFAYFPDRTNDNDYDVACFLGVDLKAQRDNARIDALWNFAFDAIEYQHVAAGGGW